MKRYFRVWIFVLLAAIFCPAARAIPGVPPPRTKATLLLSHSQVRPGERITAALRLVSEPGWHTYWRNPGDAGIATTIEWTLPPGLTAGQIEWPAPEKLLITKLYAYVYEKEVLLLIPLSISADAKPGTVTLAGAVSWLECSDAECVPQDAKVSATLTVGSESVPSSDAGLIEQWRARIPKPGSNLATQAVWELTAKAKVRKLVLEWVPQGPVAKPDFFPFESDAYIVHASNEVLEASSGKVRLRKQVDLNSGTWPDRIAGIIVNDTGRPYPSAAETSFAVPRIAGAPASPAAATAAAPIELPGAGSGPSSLAAILGLAFLGGLILNVMPCVLPVIALKILGFVNQSREDARRVRQFGILYMLGVLASFLVLAGVILAVRRVAGDVNWGIQMQNPYFVVGMTALVMLIALNLWGVFEVTVPGAALGGASELASREGSAGAFFNGVVATLLATPCTAPALGAAIGAVLTRPAYIVVLTFLTIGFGLAVPYVVLSWNPRWLKLLPKPGPWMEKFKMAMGFPMAATAVWLMSFGSLHFGRGGTLWLGIFLVLLALAAWTYGEFVQRGSAHRGLAAAVTVLILGFAYYYPLERKLHWRHLETAEVAADGGEIIESGGIRWRRWSPEAVAKARESGHPVLVDFTAAWCFTCQINKESSIEIDSVRAKLKETGAVPMIGDFTLRDKRIGTEINRYKRAGVPLVLVFPADTNSPAIVLPEILTPGTVLTALDMAAKSSAAAARTVSSRY